MNKDKSTLESLFDNVRFLSKDVIGKILSVEKFTTPEIATFGLGSFQMSAQNGFKSP